jgi:predicted GNAT family acetyltransferase
VNATARNNPDESRYELEGDGRIISIAEYKLVDDVVVFTHTETAEDLREQGFAERLVEFALDNVRLSGRTVVPRCEFVRNYIRTHPQYGDLLAA